MSKLKKNPLISVIVNCHNGERFLSEAIKSIIFQKYKNWEIIFFDNKSTDKSVKILKSFRDKRIRLYFNKTKTIFPLYKARNEAIQKAKGSFIGFLDTDDTWKKNKLYDQVKVLKKNPLIKIFYSNYICLFQETKKKVSRFNFKLPSGFITQDLLNLNFIGINTLLIDKKIFKKYKFNEKLNIIGDYDLLINLSLKFRILAIQKPLSFYRIHKNNYSKNTEIYFNEMLEWNKKNKRKLLSKKFDLSKINLMIIKLRVKMILNKLFRIRL